MSARHLLTILVVLVLAAAGWFGWRTLAGGSSREGALEAQGAAPAPVDEPRPSAELAASQELAAPPPSRAAEAEPRQAVVAEKVAPRPQWADEDAQWLEGRVELPEGTPADERVFVFAVDREMDADDLNDHPGPASEVWKAKPGFDDELVSMAEMDATGAFRIALPSDARQAHLAVAGRYLFSRASARVVLPAADPPALRPELGAWITGLLTAPAGEPVGGAEVGLGPDLSGGFDAFQINQQAWDHAGDVDADGHFAFRGVNPVIKHGFMVQDERFAAELETGIEVEAGQHLELEVSVNRGATLRGHVRDFRGQALEGATVEARYRGVMGRAIGKLRTTEADAEGAFELAHVACGKIELWARHEQLQRAHVPVERELADGDVVEGLELVLEEGLGIAGRVTFPDGSPAAAADVFAAPDFTKAVGMGSAAIAQASSGSASSGEDGRFEVTGLSKVAYKVTASLVVDEGEHAGRWGARVASVDTGGPPLELELEERVALAGRVENGAGEPVPAFSVVAALKGSGAMLGIGAETQQGKFDDEEGRFEVPDLEPGVWTVEVVADGYSVSNEVEVALPVPPGTPEFVIVLQEAAVIEGVVVDTAGAPASGAHVTLELDLASRMKIGRTGGPPEALADEQGAFRLGGLDTGTVELVASLDGFASSEPVTCETEAGMVTSDVVLRLRLGATLTGELLDGKGHPDAGKMVIVQKTPSYAAQKIMTTDADGAFRQEHLDPGTWQVVAMKNFMTEDVDQTDPEDMSSILGDMKIEFVTLVDGETTHVVLGKPPEQPVTLLGRVEHAGQPVSEALVTVMPEEAPSMSALKMQSTKKDGTFEVQLDRPGHYLVTVQRNAGPGRQSNTEFQEWIPDGVESHEIVLQMPVGRISGTVRGPDGKPLAGCRVTLNVEGGVSYGSFLGGHYTEEITDSSGHYDIDFLRAGSYAVAAGGVPMGGVLGGGAEGGRAVKSGLRVGEGDWLDDVDFRLERPGTLSGMVVDEGGAPVADAAVFVRDENGQLLEHFTLVTTDTGGRFRYEGLNPGRYCFSARTAEAASDDSDVVRVRAGETAEAKATISGGTILVVSVIDKDDEEVRAKLSVVDDRGREYSTMRSLEEIMNALGAQNTDTAHRVGPVPPGNYRLTATADDGRTVYKPVSVGERGERKVKLRLK